MPAPLASIQSLTSLTLLNARLALEQGLAAIAAGQTVFDLHNVTAVDSVAVAVMLAWRRAAQEAGVSLKLKNLPPNLTSLSKLYGVCALLLDAPEAVPQAPAMPATPQH